MAKKVIGKPKQSVLLLPFNICRDVMRTVIYCLVYRPVFCMFVCSCVTVMYLVLSSQKVQRTLSSLPYEQIFSHFKSQKMITLYATLLEVIMELLMAIVLATVSVIITVWLLFEEVADRKNNSFEEKHLSMTETSSFTIPSATHPFSKEKKRVQ